ncbi:MULTISPECIES: sensor histidine kinase [Methylorubrum]|uniref:sensor histidine kinase n=1 Tax=Methylorubrum TaxID=2282523 RepID=UPI0020A05CBC|nr:MULTISPECIES: sensor histidine kinase [Methylorubrum]MCP1548650.1 two-component sensor histidine kinase [Methylorubrum zatmanii]MCP1554736.1 two-component sensor histidine kinase [Methylorubrum extorquens]MCP1578953.1 two-component sensor histidine kinase [Methylorubrum extorquens]
MNQDPRDARIEELEAENRRLRRFLDETGLPAELRHKVRNTLSMLRAIIRRSAETSDSVESYVAHLDGRLDALARVLNALMRSVPEGIGLHSLVADELLVHLAREGEQVAISGPSLFLRPGAAEVLAMAIHELAVNAVEHGALTVPQGCIHVTWTLSQPVESAGSRPRLTFVWEESGLADLKPAPSHCGFGMEVLKRSLRYELKAETTLAFEPQGLRCTISLPLPAQITVIGDEE